MSTATLDKIVGRNVYVGATAAEVKDDLNYIHREENPDAIALQEVSGDIRWMDDWARQKGYILHVRTRYDYPRTLERQEAQSSALLIRKRIPQARRTAIINKVKWKGPKRNIWRPGRTFPTALAGRPAARLTSIHMPTGKNTKANAPAWRETWVRLRSTAARMRRRAIWLGDWNDPWFDRSTYSIHSLAKAMGAKLVRDEGRIDYALVRGAKRAWMETKLKLNSDHAYFVLYIEW